MKRVLMWLIVVLVTIAGAAAAGAQEEVPPPETKPTAGYKGGFFIQSPDGDFKMKFNGRIQPKLYYQKQTGAAGDWSFRIRRAMVFFSATIAERASFNVALLHSTRSALYDTMNVVNATASYEFGPAFILTAGTVGIPLSLAGGTGSLGYHMLEAPLVITQEDGGVVTPARSSFGNPDGLGLNASGEFSKFFYELSVVNGAARTTLDDPATDVDEAAGGVESNFDLNFNKRVSVGAKFGMNIFGAANSGIQMDLPYSEKAGLAVSLGGNYQGGRQDPYTEVIIDRILTGSLGAAFRWRGLSVNAEAFGRRMTLQDPGLTTWFEMSMDDLGYLLDTGYFIIKNKLEAALMGSQIFREGPDNNSYQFGGAVNWYINGTNNLKLQLGYTVTVDYDDIAGAKNSRTHHIGTMFTAAF